jgi:hypothetical protein
MKRYNSLDGYVLVEEPDGEYVLYEDHIDEIKWKNDVISDYKITISKKDDRIKELESENRRLADQLERTQGYEAGMAGRIKALENCIHMLLAMGDHPQSIEDKADALLLKSIILSSGR